MTKKNDDINSLFAAQVQHYQRKKMHETVRTSQVRQLREEGKNPFMGQQEAWIESLVDGSNDKVKAWVFSPTSLTIEKVVVDIEVVKKLRKDTIQFWLDEKPLKKWQVWKFQAAAREEAYIRIRLELKKINNRKNKLKSALEEVKKEMKL